MVDHQPPASPAQADRDAAADYGRMIGRLTSRDADCVRNGEWDDTKDVQFFATRRLSAIAPGGVDREAMFAAVEAVIIQDDQLPTSYERLANRITDAILSLIPQAPAESR